MLSLLSAFTVSLAGLVQIIIFLLIAGCIIGLLFYLIHILPIPEPYKGWIKIVLQVLVVLFIIGVLLNFAGVPIIQLK